MNKRTQFKITHLKSKTNREENLDATEEFHDLTKNNDATTSVDEKKRARAVSGTGTKSVEKYNVGHVTKLLKRHQQLCKKVTKTKIKHAKAVAENILLKKSAMKKKPKLLS